MKTTIPSKELVAEGLDILQALASYGAWVEPGPPGQEPSYTLIGGRHLIEAREQEVAAYLIGSLERVDILWLFAADTGANDAIRLAKAWARALLPPDHELHTPLSVEDQTLLDQHLQGDQTHGQ